MFLFVSIFCPFRNAMASVENNLTINRKVWLACLGFEPGAAG